MTRASTPSTTRLRSRGFREAMGLPHRDREGHTAHFGGTGAGVAHVELELCDFLAVVARALRAHERDVLEQRRDFELLHEASERLDVDRVADEPEPNRVADDLGRRR